MSLLWSLNAVSMTGRQVPRLDRVTVEIARGVTAVLGPSGAGKTSLLNVLAGFERPQSGTVAFQGEGAGESLGVFWSPASHGLWPHLTIREHLQMVARPDRAEELLSNFDLLPLADARPGALSLGERSRLSVARAVASGAKALVLDEPLAHVDEARVGSYWKVIREACAATDTSIVFATHSPEVALREASHALCMTHGRVAYSGSMRELYERPASRELATMLGPCNWLTDVEVGRWLSKAVSSAERRGYGSAITPATGSVDEPMPGDEKSRDGHCIRPERLEIALSETGPLRVKETRFAGASAEVALVDERDGASRSFVHRPASFTLKAGDRVVMRVLAMLLVMLCCTGCDYVRQPVLTPRQENYWSMPPDGQRVPAPRGMTVSPQGEYLVLDNAGRVLVFDKDGEFQRQWWMPEYSVGKPEGICVLKDGRIAVADTHYHRVVLFDHDGKVTGMFGSLGEAPGQFVYPVAIAQDDKEFLYVCEYGNYNDRVQKFRPDGTYVAQLGGYGTEAGGFQRPSGIAWHKGRLYVVDAFNNRIQVFEEDGKQVAILSGSDKMADVYYPYDIAITPRDEIYVVEYGAGRLSKFDLNGRLLGRYGQTGGGRNEFKTPWGMALDSRGRVYVCDTGNRRIVELEF